MLIAFIHWEGRCYRVTRYGVAEHWEAISTGSYRMQSKGLRVDG